MSTPSETGSPLLAVYEKQFEPEDFVRWVRERTNVLTLTVMILESLIVLASLVVGILAIVYHYAYPARIIAELVLVIVCLALIIYWRYGYPKSAGKKLYDNYKTEMAKSGARKYQFYEDHFDTLAGDAVIRTVSYGDGKEVRLSQELLSFDLPDQICYLFRRDGFTEETLTVLQEKLKH